MKQNTINLILIITIATLLRFYYLSEIPAGVSLFEIKVGNYLGTNNIFTIRLPFVLLSLLSILLTYKISYKLLKNKNLATISALMISITPWHLQFSRIANLEILFLVIFLTILNLLLNFDRKKLSKIILYLSFTILIISIVKIDRSTSNLVNNERHLISNQVTGIVPKIFTNKLTENVSLNIDRYYEKLDFGYYFFKGQPKPRWGSEEIPRLLIFQIPLLIIGFMLFDKNNKYLMGTIFVFISVLSVALSNYDFDIEFIITFLGALISSVAINSILKNKNTLGLIILLLLFFEFASFFASYLNGHEESIFSGRRPHFINLVNELDRLDSKNILITDRISNAREYVNFYLPNNNFEFRSYEIRKEQFNYDYYIGVLPDDPSSGEELYSENDWPNEIEVISTVYDPTQRFTNVIYKYVGK